MGQATEDETGSCDLRVAVKVLKRLRKQMYKHRALTHPGRRSLGSAGMGESRDILFINVPGGLGGP